MTEDLKICRERLDKIDKEIIELFQERMETVKGVAEFKVKNNMKIFDKKREQSMIERNSQLVNPELKKYYVELLKCYLKVSKEYQRQTIKNIKKNKTDNIR